jgi:hypothetical protein
LDLAMFVFEQRIFIITFIISFNHCWSLHPHGFQFSWIPSQTFHHLVFMISFWWWWIVWQRCFIFISCTKIITSKGTTKLFLDHVFRYHGFSKHIIYNHGLEFVSKS